MMWIHSVIGDIFAGIDVLALFELSSSERKVYDGNFWLQTPSVSCLFLLNNPFLSLKFALLIVDEVY